MIGSNFFVKHFFHADSGPHLHMFELKKKQLRTHYLRETAYQTNPENIWYNYISFWGKIMFEIIILIYSYSSDILQYISEYSAKPNNRQFWFYNKICNINTFFLKIANHQ